MSGHSKWATTKRQKAVVDAKRGALFTKIGNQIAIAARSGTDPAMNPSLAMVLEKARLANMPKANIERAIARVADKSGEKPFTNTISNQSCNYSKESVFRQFRTSPASHSWEALNNPMWPEKPIQAG